MTTSARRALLIPFVGLLLLFGWVYMAVDREQFAELSSRASWVLVLLALGCSLASYLFISLALLLIGRTIGLRRVTTPMFLLVTFVSLTLNHVISLGVAGYSVRVLLLRHHGEAPGTVLAASLLHSYLTTLVMVALLPIGIGAIAFSPTGTYAGTTVLWTATVASTAAVLGMTLALLSRSLRLWLFGMVTRLGRLLSHDHAAELVRALADLDIGLATAMHAVRYRPAAMLLPLLLTVVDWMAVLAAFWLCLEAVGELVELRVLIAGFAVGMNVGVVSLMPGGVGVQEGAQAGVLALFGVPFQTALLAAVLFRVVYYLVPFLVSLPVYYLVLRPLAPRDEPPASAAP